jgi:pilus assembly protein TadC
MYENRNQGGDDWAEGMFAGGFGVLIPVIVISLIMRRRRKKRRTAEPAMIPGADSTERLERLERGMESIAIEIERVSEGQRFVTKLLSESAQPVGARRIE